MSSITLSSNGTTLAIYVGMQWTDEFKWSPVAMSAEHSTDGSLLIDQAVRQAGRPITLEMPEGAGWATHRANVLLFAAWAARTGEVLQLTLRGRTFAVMFNHASGQGFEAELMTALADEAIDADALYRVTFRFLEV